MSRQRPDHGGALRLKPPARVLGFSELRGQNERMAASPDTLVLTIPRSVASELPALSRSLVDRMHALLERNTDGALGATEREEVATLVEMAQFAELLAAAASGARAA